MQTMFDSNSQEVRVETKKYDNNNQYYYVIYGFDENNLPYEIVSSEDKVYADTEEEALELGKDYVNEIL